MLSLFWGIGPAFVVYLLLRDWWNQVYVPTARRWTEGDDGDD